MGNLATFMQFAVSLGCWQQIYLEVCTFSVIFITQVEFVVIHTMHQPRKKFCLLRTKIVVFCKV